MRDATPFRNAQSPQRQFRVSYRDAEVYFPTSGKVLKQVRTDDGGVWVQAFLVTEDDLSSTTLTYTEIQEDLYDPDDVDKYEFLKPVNMLHKADDHGNVYPMMQLNTEKWNALLEEIRTHDGP